MNLSVVQRTFLDIIKRSINNEIEQTVSLPEQQFKDLFILAEEQNLLPMVVDYLFKSRSINSVETDVKESCGTVGDVGLDTLGVRRADIDGIGVVDHVGTQDGVVNGTRHGAYLVGVGTPIGIQTHIAELHDILAETSLEIVGVA